MDMEFHAAVSSLWVVGTDVRHVDVRISQEWPARGTEGAPEELELARGDDDRRVLVDRRKVVVAAHPPLHSTQDETRRMSHVYPVSIK